MDKVDSKVKKKKARPSMKDGLILYVIGFLALIFLGGYFQIKFKMNGIVMTQLMIISLPIIYACCLRCNMKKVFSLKLPSLKQCIGAVSFWIGSYIIVFIVTNIVMYYFPQSQQVSESLNDALFMKDSFWMNIIVVALMPAICEEIFFRGFMLSAFKNNRKSYVLPIIFSGILFGIMHLDFIRMIPTSILGMSFAYAVCKTKSIGVSMIMHYMNNSLSVVAMHLSSNMELSSGSSELVLFSFKQIIIFLGFSLVFLGIGDRLFKSKKKRKKKVKAIEK